MGEVQRFPSWATADLAWLLDELLIEPAAAVPEGWNEATIAAARAELARRRAVQG